MRAAIIEQYGAYLAACLGHHTTAISFEEYAGDQQSLFARAEKEQLDGAAYVVNASNAHSTLPPGGGNGGSAVSASARGDSADGIAGASVAVTETPLSKTDPEYLAWKAQQNKTKQRGIGPGDDGSSGDGASPSAGGATGEAKTSSAHLVPQAPQIPIKDIRLKRPDEIKKRKPDVYPLPWEPPPPQPALVGGGDEPERGGAAVADGVEDRGGGGARQAATGTLYRGRKSWAAGLGITLRPQRSPRLADAAATSNQSR